MDFAIVVAVGALALRVDVRTAGRRTSPTMGLDGERDDLQDAVSFLRRSYYGSTPFTGILKQPWYNKHSALHAQRSDLLGSLELPVVYSSYPLLPYSQTVLDVWQREEGFSAAVESFIHLFEALLQSPQPWYYAHATVFGEGRARTTGTLMRVVNTKRTPDGRLQVLVQGLGRLRILNETRSDPFPEGGRSADGGCGSAAAVGAHAHRCRRASCTRQHRLQPPAQCWRLGVRACMVALRRREIRRRRGCDAGTKRTIQRVHLP